MPATQRSKTTPPKLAEAWGISVNKILAFIRSGELRAINIAATDRNRPRYLIDLTDVEAFENARQVVPDATPKPARRRKPTAIKDYFVTDATGGEQWAALEQQQAVPTAKRPELEARP